MMDSDLLCKDRLVRDDAFTTHSFWNTAEKMCVRSFSVIGIILKDFLNSAEQRKTTIIRKEKIDDDMHYSAL